MPRCCPKRASSQPYLICFGSYFVFEGVQIGFGEFLRVGVPVTVATLAWGAVWLWMAG